MPVLIHNKTDLRRIFWRHLISYIYKHTEPMIWGMFESGGRPIHPISICILHGIERRLPRPLTYKRFNLHPIQGVKLGLQPSSRVQSCQTEDWARTSLFLIPVMSRWVSVEDVVRTEIAGSRHTKSKSQEEERRETGKLYLHSHTLCSVHTRNRRLAGRIFIWIVSRCTREYLWNAG